MWRNKNHMRRSNNQCGVTIVELMLSLAISSVIFGGVLKEYSSIIRHLHDHQVRLETLVQAQAIVQTLTSELRLIGNGVPFDQPNFEIGENTLSDPTVTEPILVASASASAISFRLNETGNVFLLTADFNPGVSLVATVTDASELEVNDPIYISNSVIAGDEGLHGTIADVDHNTNTITLASDYVASPGAVFGMGSLVEEVPTVTYASVDGTGITRDSGFGAVLLGMNSSMALQYLDYDQNPLTLPLTNDHLVDSLRSIRVTITKTSDRTLSNGAEHSITVSQIVGIRNLNYFF